MSEDQELDYVNDPEPTAETHNTVHSGRRLKVTVLRVAVVLTVVLIVAYVFDGVALFLHAKECSKGLQTTINLTTLAPETPPPTTTTTKTATNSLNTATSPVPVPTCPLKLHCDTGWELRRICYYFSTNKLSWIQSKAKCTSMGGQLVKINSREEQNFLSGKLRSLMTDIHDRFWIGLTDSETEGVWKWTDGSLLDPSLQFWYTIKKNSVPEPDNWTGQNNEYPEGEDCVRMGDKAYDLQDSCWLDQHCDSLQKYICEKNPTQSQDCQ